MTSPSWGQCADEQKLTALDAATGEYFGYSASVSGDTAVVGAFNDDDACPLDPNCNSGSAYVFVRSGAVWTQQQKLTASDAAAIGSSVSVSGDTVVVGANRDNSPATDAGSAYVFVRSGVVWSPQQKLIASDAAANDEFGISVSVSGDTAVVGAWLDDNPGTNSGSAYVFTRSGVVWTPQQKLTASDAAAGDIFGYAVSLSGDTVLVGADQDVHAGMRSGSAYVFTRSGVVWSPQQKLKSYRKKPHGDRWEQADV